MFPRPVCVTRLEKPTLLGTTFCCGGHPEVAPAGGAEDVGFVEGTVTDVAGEEGDGEVVVGVFYCAGDGAVGDVGAGMGVVGVDGDVA